VVWHGVAEGGSTEPTGSVPLISHPITAQEIGAHAHRL
jgi:hypothetical protein